MSSVNGYGKLVAGIAAVLVLGSLPACSNSTRNIPPATESHPVAPPPDPRFPSDIKAQEIARPAEWLFWLLPSEGDEASGCYAKGESEFAAKWSAHTYCTVNFPTRRFYSVGGCTSPQRMAYATSEDTNFTWHVCVSDRLGWQQAQAEAVRLCESRTEQRCTGQWPLPDTGASSTGAASRRERSRSAR